MIHTDQVIANKEQVIANKEEGTRNGTGRMPRNQEQEVATQRTTRECRASRGGEERKGGAREGRGSKRRKGEQEKEGGVTHLAAPAVGVGNAAEMQGLREVVALPAEAHIRAVTCELVLHLPVGDVLEVRYLHARAILRT
jgi:hypothetical protein